MTTEARDALARALADHREAIYWEVESPQTGIPPERRLLPIADAILAALDGWTLVPVDTVADAEASRPAMARRILLWAVESHDASGDVRDAVGLVRHWLDDLAVGPTE
jgi:hypothetical protein